MLAFSLFDLSLSLVSFAVVVEQKLEQEIKEREEKYADLDAKFTRLHKRAKQRIQEIQKVNLSSLWLL